MIKQKKKTKKKTSKKSKNKSYNINLSKVMSSMMGNGPMMQMSGMGSGPGTHAPVQASGAVVGKMADGKMIHLSGPKMGQMVI